MTSAKGALDSETGCLGTLAWGERRGGRLGVLEMFAQARDGLAARLRARPPAGVTGPELREVRRLALPETPLVAWAATQCRTASEPWLLAHCFRTYLFGALLARRDGLVLDDEVAATASLLHDLGLTPSCAPAPGECFAVRGAREALRLLGEREVDEARRLRIADAISLHLCVRVPPSLGAEAHLVHEGAAYDVVGARWREVAPEARAAVLSAHPRDGMKRRLGVVIRDRVRASPRTRIALLCRFGFLGLIAGSPFEE